MNRENRQEDSLTIGEITLVFRYIDPSDHYPIHQSGRMHHGLFYAVEGCEEYRLRDRVLKTRPGDVFYLPKSAQYEIEMHDPSCTVLCINFETASPTHPQAFLIHCANPHLFKSCFLDIERCWQLKQSGWRMECMSIAYRILAEVERQASQKYLPGGTMEKIQPGADYLHRHFADTSLRTDCLAELCGLHPRSFARIFKEVYGVSPKQYLTQLRMDHARELLLTGRCSVSQVAQLTGYGEIYHFSKAFKQENGVSPSEYGEKTKRYEK